MHTCYHMLGWYWATCGRSTGQWIAAVLRHWHP